MAKRTRYQERGFILELRRWQVLCLDSERNWLFPSPVTGRPYHADSIRTDYLVPTDLKLRLGRDRVSHVPSHIRAWLDETGAPGGRIAETHATRAGFNHNGPVRRYLGLGQAQSQSANRATPLAQVCHSADLYSINKGNCEAVPLIGQFWTVVTRAQLPVTLCERPDT